LEEIRIRIKGSIIKTVKNGSSKPMDQQYGLEIKRIYKKQSE
jgi:hypothetical protein